MDYAGARSWLDGLGEFHMEFGLDRVRAVLDRLGNPERCAPAIHVAGTNGKGATCAFISSILRHAGRRVGLYTSPHLSRPNERISLSGTPIEDERFAEAVTTTRDALEASGVALTYFEAMTVAAFVAFRHAEVEVMVVEVGLGGRLDATNVLEPAVTVITSIALDHTSILGSTLEEIAAEKAGILERGVPVVLAAREPAAVEVVTRRASEIGAPVVRTKEGADGDWESVGADGIRLGGGPVVRLAGYGQSLVHAAAAAVTAVRLQSPALSVAVMAEGLRRAAWPGRMEEVRAPGGGPAVLLDGGHNPAAARALASVDPLDRHVARGVLLFAAMADKDYPGMLRALAETGAGRIVCTSAGTARSATARSLAESAREVFGDAAAVEAIDDVPVALARALECAGPHGSMLVTGSLYLVGRVREILTGGPPTAIG